MENIRTETRILALAQYLEIGPEDISESRYDETLFDVGSEQYLVLSDDEATEKAKEYIKDSVWAFNSSFLAGFCDLPEEVFKALQEGCENSNDAVLSLIEKSGDFDDFADQAISSDGRGHFLNTYDGEENEHSLDTENMSEEELKDWNENGEPETYYIYRIN